jgi:hypothetical protein
MGEANSSGGKRRNAYNILFEKSECDSQFRRIRKVWRITRIKGNVRELRENLKGGSVFL